MQQLTYSKSLVALQLEILQLEHVTVNKYK